MNSNNIIKNIFLIATVLIFLKSCEAPEVPTSLPEITTTGENTFGCYINDEIYIPEIRDLSFTSEIIFEYPKYPDYLFTVETNRIANEKDEFDDVFLVINIENVTETMTYSIKSSVIYYNDNSYHLDTSFIHNLIVSHIDTIQEIISGTFSYTAKNVETNEKLYITEGRFDLKSR
ncbi:MAG: hypothetical protein JXB49_07390 [Bacteroidales bacterium]|nr:hypothetical protein [Bacteroidales bacterium]MBN2821037.1 hypothetical protein [Bacteroidales bacterium]